MNENKKLVSDLDNTLRDLFTPLTPFGFEENPSKWKNFNHEGKNFLDFYDENPKKLSEPFFTSYFKNIFRYLKIDEIWTVIPKRKDEWENFTYIWQQSYTPNIPLKIFRNFEEREEAIHNLNGYIFDDYPFYSDYSKVIVVTWNYNKHLKDQAIMVENEEDILKLRNERCVYAKR